MFNVYNKEFIDQGCKIIRSVNCCEKRQDKKYRFTPCGIVEAT